MFAHYLKEFIVPSSLLNCFLKPDKTVENWNFFMYPICKDPEETAPCITFFVGKKTSFHYDWRNYLDIDWITNILLMGRCRPSAIN